MARTYIEFEGFNEAVKRLNDLEGDVKSITEKALKETHKLITEKAEEAIRPHHETGQTEESLYREGKVNWSGTIGSVETGFSIRKGGLASIFLMYGTPRMKKDQKMYNAFWGSKTKKEVMELQEKIFFDEIRRLGG